MKQESSPENPTFFTLYCLQRAEGDPKPGRDALKKVHSASEFQFHTLFRNKVN